jgi:hypothetical protein
MQRHPLPHLVQLIGCRLAGLSNPLHLAERAWSTIAVRMQSTREQRWFSHTVRLRGEGQRHCGTRQRIFNVRDLDSASHALQQRHWWRGCRHDDGPFCR